VEGEVEGGVANAVAVCCNVLQRGAEVEDAAAMPHATSHCNTQQHSATAARRGNAPSPHHVAPVFLQMSPVYLQMSPTSPCNTAHVCNTQQHSATAARRSNEASPHSVAPVFPKIRPVSPQMSPASLRNAAHVCNTQQHSATAARTNETAPPHKAAQASPQISHVSPQTSHASLQMRSVSLQMRLASPHNAAHVCIRATAAQTHDEDSAVLVVQQAFR